MINPTFRHCFLLPFFAFSFLFAFGLHAQQPQDKDPVRVSIEDKGWSDDGSLVLCVRIHAPAGRDLKLYTGTLGSNTGANTKSDYQAFTLGGSYLVDGYTGNKIESLPQLPRKPFLAPRAMGANVARGGWVELGVAFSLPAPPLGSDGKPLPYKLTLFTPLNSPPIPVIPPTK